MTHAISLGGFKPVRHDQLRQEYEHDTYRPQQKLQEPSVCADCGAVYDRGRWLWSERPAGAEEVVCPACQRTRDHYPAGFVFIAGPFFEAHREELMRLLRHHEEKAKGLHALVRIMDVEDDEDSEDGGIVVTTTDIRLARDFGEALYHAYAGELEFHYNEGEKLLRVHWRR